MDNDARHLSRFNCWTSSFVWQLAKNTSSLTDCVLWRNNNDVIFKNFTGYRNYFYKSSISYVPLTDILNTIHNSKHCYKHWTRTDWVPCVITADKALSSEVFSTIATSALSASSLMNLLLSPVLDRSTDTVRSRSWHKQPASCSIIQQFRHR